MLQCHSPKSSHPLPLPQSPKDCSIHQCLFCCLVYRVIVTIFLLFEPVRGTRLCAVLGMGWTATWGQFLSEETTKQLFTQRNHYSHKKLCEREVTEAVRHIRGSWLGWGLRNGFSEEGTFEWRSAGRVHCCRKHGLRRRKGGKAGAEQEWQLEVPRWVEAGEANHYNVQSCKALQLVFRVLTLSPRTIRSHCLKGLKLGSRY